MKITWTTLPYHLFVVTLLVTESTAGDRLPAGICGARSRVKISERRISTRHESVTLNDLERRNGRVVCVILPNSVDFGGVLRKSSGRYTDRPTFCK